MNLLNRLWLMEQVTGESAIQGITGVVQFQWQFNESVATIDVNSA